MSPIEDTETLFARHRKVPWEATQQRSDESPLHGHIL